MTSNALDTIAKGDGANPDISIMGSQAFARAYTGDGGQSEIGMHGIIGSSQPMKAVLDQIGIVAPTDSTVLIQGETGTGKELAARAVHKLSSRPNGPFVTINCAAIPAGLLESELFGHERGAFTGAVTQRKGRFELANGGTLFLDEIGDVPIELQVKLLRVLQEREFERLGSTHTCRVDVRVIAATHRDLLQMIEDETFRADLYYRVSVFPIELPPLRDRLEDIPQLVWHFVARYAERMNKILRTIPPEAMEAMLSYDWPGNIRELQNFVERGVIVSRRPVFEPHIEELRTQRARPGKEERTLEDFTRSHILQTLKEVNWVIGGPNGAASRLGIPRTTLIAKMRRLGIESPTGTTRGRGMSS